MSLHTHYVANFRSKCYHKNKFLVICVELNKVFIFIFYRCKDGKPSAIESLTLGACSRSLAGLCMLPITVVKTRFESEQFQYKSMKQALTTIYSREGFKGNVLVSVMYYYYSCKSIDFILL